jgi:hypothetical protein
MALDAYACESIAYMTTGMIDRGDPDCYVEAAICKVRVDYMCTWHGVWGLCERVVLGHPNGADYSCPRWLAQKQPSVALTSASKSWEARTSH